MPRTLLAVFAHPDDDAYGIAGTVALHADDPEFRFVLVLATDGGAGDIRDGFPATRETLGAIRQAEDAAAWQALGRVPERHEWLGYADGEVDCRGKRCGRGCAARSDRWRQRRVATARPCIQARTGALHEYAPTSDWGDR